MHFPFPFLLSGRLLSLSGRLNPLPYLAVPMYRLLLLFDRPLYLVNLLSLLRCSLLS